MRAKTVNSHHFHESIEAPYVQDSEPSLENFWLNNRILVLGKQAGNINFSRKRLKSKI